MNKDLEMVKLLALGALPATATYTRKLLKYGLQRSQLTALAGTGLGLIVTSLGPLRQYRGGVALGAVCEAAERILDFLAKKS